MAGFRILDDEAPAGGFRILDAPKADPKIGQPEELSFAEKYLAPVLDKLGSAVQSDTGVVGAAARGITNNGNMRGGVVGRVMQGAADPGVAIAQLAANAVGAGDSVNKGIADEEKQYQAARAEAGSTGFDPARLAGNIGMTAFTAAAAPGTLPERLGTYGKAAIQGAGYSALQPVTDGGGSYWKEKGKEALIGALAGPATAAVGGGLARVVSPNASTNADLALLKGEGVQPTIGQSLGGWANNLEEKAQSLPFLGDAITAMRKRAFNQFNEAATNRAISPIGATVNPGTGGGQRVVAGAGDLLSNEYDSALSKLGKVNFDTPTFDQGLKDATEAATGLSPPMQQKFANTVKEVFRRMESDGSMTGEAFQKADSDLKAVISRYGKSGTASEQDFADVAQQFRDSLFGEVTAANPEIGARLGAANEGWANLVRVEGAAKAAKNNNGVFTPAQLNSAIQGADDSVRKRAVSRGEALMQDLGNAGQNVLGNKYPDSGTVGRGLAATLGLGAAYVHPAIPAGLAAGAAAYTPVVQNALRALVASRPDAAPKVANELRRLMQAGTVVTVPMVEAIAR